LRSFTTFLLLLVWTASTFGQSIDSMQQILANSTDTALLRKTYPVLIYELQKKDGSGALDYARQFISFEQKEAFRIALAKARIRNKNTLDKTQEAFQRAIEIAKDRQQQCVILFDSIQSLENIRAAAETLARYETERQLLIQDTLEKAVQLRELTTREQNAEAKAQTWLVVSLSIGLALALLAFLMVARQRKAKKSALAEVARQKASVEEQKKVAEQARNETEKLHQIAIDQQLVTDEEKSQQILTSVQYAGQMQEAILPPAKMREKLLPYSFVFYQPREVVSGDFYWVGASGSKVFFALADCAGNDASGAMLSVLAANSLNSSVKELGLIAPGAILDQLSQVVQNTFGDASTQVCEGMHISLCVWDRKAHTLHFAGAKSPLYLWRPDGSKGLKVDGKQSIPLHNGPLGTLYEISGDPQPIGHLEGLRAFVQQQVEIQPDDRLFLFSDGFTDQLGGEHGQKLKPQNFHQMLSSVQDQPMVDQEISLANMFKQWQGDHEQGDDVSVMGVRLA